MIRLAEIPYLNCAPFYWNKNLGTADFEVQWVPASPKDLGQRIREGSLDGGPVSLLDSFEMEEHWEPIPFGITAIGPAQSVILFSQEPIKNLDQKETGLTPQSATSSELLKIILAEKYRIEPLFRQGFQAEDAARLLIGNQALFALLDPVWRKEFPHQMDLGTEWREWTGLPFVFARWMVKKDLDGAVQAGIEDWLLGNLKGFEENPAHALEQFEKGRGWKLPQAKEYLAGFNFSIGKTEKQSMETFQNFLRVPSKI